MLDAALGCVRRGLRVFPVYEFNNDGTCTCGKSDCNKAGKHPRIKDWPMKATTDEEQVRRWWQQSPNANIGVATGQGSNLVIVDIDSPDGEAWVRARFGGALPQTLTSRTGRGIHLWFQCPRGGLRKGILVKGVDLLGDGANVIAPPSLHKSGRRYEWIDPTVPVAILPDSLLSMRAGTDANTAEPEEPIGEGDRHNRLLSYAASLFGQGLSANEVRKRVHEYNGTLCTPPLLQEEVDAIVDWVAKQEAKKIESAVERLNREYAVVIAGGRTVILKEGQDENGQPITTFLSVSDFHKWLRPETIWIGQRERFISHLWFNSTQRHAYDGLVFDPSNTTPSRYYNLWQGFAIQPAPPGSSASCQRFLNHILENVCQGNQELFRWVIGWFAAIVQHPAKKVGTSLVLRGSQGTGKTMIGQYIGPILGSHYTNAADARYLVGQFNGHLANLLLLQLDEAVLSDNREATGRLKDLVTGDWQFIEYKGKEPMRVRNHVRLLMTTNNYWVVPAALEERRFAVLDMGDGHRQDHPYFQAIMEEAENGGRAALLRYLLDFDLADIPLHQIPRTNALMEQKLASLPLEQAWWLDVLKSGTLPKSGLGSGKTFCNALYQNYLDFAARVGYRSRMTQSAWGSQLHRMVPNLRRDREGTGARRYYYHLPPLDQCRAFFARFLGDDLWAEPNSPDPSVDAEIVQWVEEVSE
jgi:hypothetical protein